MIPSGYPSLKRGIETKKRTEDSILEKSDRETFLCLTITSQFLTQRRCKPRNQSSFLRECRVDLKVILRSIDLSRLGRILYYERPILWAAHLVGDRFAVFLVLGDCFGMRYLSKT